ncbi:hypothetical protein [Nonomuraea sp. NPDC049480]|uniref:hypothetical protein n=1 Tax=Nonomuraea sp. NPDC049480 TaxID=3364353 RepID=UPI0037A598BA
MTGKTGKWNLLGVLGAAALMLGTSMPLAAAESVPARTRTPAIAATQSVAPCTWAAKPYGRKINGRWHVVGRGGSTCKIGGSDGFVRVTLQQKRAWGWDSRQVLHYRGTKKGVVYPRAKCRDFSTTRWRTWTAYVNLGYRHNRYSGVLTTKC